MVPRRGPGNALNFGAALPGNVLDWRFNLNLATGDNPLSVGSGVNLRAGFLDIDGENAGILSPNGGPLVSGCHAASPLRA